MPSDTHRPVPTHLDIIPFRFDEPTNSFHWIICQHCNARLDLSQPAVEAPTRLIGVCEGCRRWHLILIEPDMATALMVVLPESQAFRDAWNAHGELTRGGESASTGPETSRGADIIKIHDDNSNFRS